MHRFFGRFVHRTPAPVTPKEAAEMVRGCESFLGGRLLETLSGDSEPIPEWAWISVLAHAPEEYLADCASRGLPPHAEDRGIWSRTLCVLSALLLDHAARTGKPLGQLQHDIVLPIELQAHVRPIAPSTCVRLLTSALGDLAPVAQATATEGQK